jgi:hypothetical protein
VVPRETDRHERWSISNGGENCLEEHVPVKFALREFHFATDPPNNDDLWDKSWIVWLEEARFVLRTHHGSSQ